MSGSKIHFFVSLAGTHWGPPSGFGYPRDGLRPSIPGRSCFIPAALLGFPLRSSALTGRPNVIERTGPPTVPPVVAPTTFAVGRPDGLRFLGFAPGESSSRRRVCLALPPRETPLGFVPSRVLREGLDQDSARSPLTRFADCIVADVIGRRTRVSIGPRLARPCPRVVTRGASRYSVRARDAQPS
jgi:hypothetical protein